MNTPIDRNKPSYWLSTLWTSRRLILAAIVLGILLWFILANSQLVTIHFPFGLGRPTASIGLIVLLSAAAGSGLTMLLMTFLKAMERYRPPARTHSEPRQHIPDIRPPADYAARTPEGFSDAPWSAR